MPASRVQIDWDAIRSLYRTGQLSNREIARRYGISDVAILKKAKREGWSKDLANQVATGVKEAVISSQLAKAPANHRRAKQRAAKQSEIVKAAIEEGKLVVLRHMETGKLLADNGARLSKIIENKIATMELDPQGADTSDLFTLARAHESIVRAMANTVEIERKSRGLDDQPPDPNAPAAIQITYYRQDKVLQLGGGDNNDQS